MGSWVIEHQSTWLAFGLVLVAAATAVRHAAAERDEGDFLVQLALALGLAGQGLAIAGVAVELDSASGAFLFGALLELTLLFVFPDPLQRFISTVAGVAFLAALLLEIDERLPLHVLAVPCLLGVDLLARAPNASGSLRWETLRGPALHGLAVAAFGLVLLVLVTDDGLATPGERLWGLPWLTAIGVSAVFLAQTWRLSRGRMTDRSRHLLVAGTALLAAITCMTPALIVGVSVMAVGWDTRRALLLSLAVAFSSLALFALYYDLDLSLLGKSVTLIASGGLLLGIRRLVPVAAPATPSPVAGRAQP